MKKFWAMMTVCWTVLATSGAERLPAYGSEAWEKLPGMSEVAAAAKAGDPVARYLLIAARYEVTIRDGIRLDVVDREWAIRAPMPKPATIMASGSGVKKIEKFAKDGFFLAQRLLGESMLGKNDLAAAAQWFRRAAEQGDAVSQYNYGRYLITRNDSETEFRKGLWWWELSAEQGNAGALKDLGVAYDDGSASITGKPEMKTAIRYYKRAIAAGNAPAGYLLGEIYATGRNGIPIDKDLAIQYYRLAAAQHPDVEEMRGAKGAQLTREAEFYRYERDDKNELEILKAAADMGWDPAKLGLAINLFTGNRAVKRDKAEGLRQLTELASGITPSALAAQGWLAQFLMQENRHEEAVYWYCRALGNGNPRAYHIDKTYLLTHRPNPAQRRLLRGVIILAESGDESMQKIRQELEKAGIDIPKEREEQPPRSSADDPGKNGTRGKDPAQGTAPAPPLK